MKRSEAREFAMQVIFHMEVHNEFLPQVLIKFPVYETLGEQKSYVDELIQKLCDNIELIDEKINEHSKKWSVKRMPKADLAVARLASCEILFMEDIPKAVSINEAVELAKKYGTENSAKFINAVLKNI